VTLVLSLHFETNFEAKQYKPVKSVIKQPV